MANYSGSVTSNTSKYGCYLEVTESNVNTANNTSLVTVKFHITRSNYGWQTSNSYSGNITIDGSSYSFSYSPNWAYASSGDIVIATASKTVTHNNDGSKTCSVSGSWSTSGTYSCGTASASGSMTLTTIARATTPTLSFSSIDLGEAITINTPRASSSFTHELYFKIGTSAKTQIAADVTTSYTWENNLYLINWLPNATSGTVTIYCQTYNGSTYIGEKSVTFTGKVPETITPSIDSFSVTEYVEEVATNIGKYVQGKSRLDIKSSASGDYNSTITSYKIYAQDETFTEANAITSVLKSSGLHTIKVVATDSRGRTASRGVTINVIEYFAPQAGGLWVERCDINGTLKDDGTYVKAYMNYEIAPIDNLNDKKAIIQYLNGEQWETVATFTDSYSAVSREHVITNTTFNIDNTYKFKLVVEDSFSSDDWNALPLPTSYTLMNYHKSGKAIGFGKVATREEGFQFGDFIYDQWDTVITNGLAVYGGDPDTTLESLIMTSTNSPTGFAMYFHTFFASNKSEGQNRGQIAIPYLGSGSMYYRWRFSGTWTEWKRLVNYNEVEKLLNSHAGEMIWLYKSSSQALSANTKTQVTYDKTYYNSSNGSLTKDGNSIVIGENVNVVNVSCRFRDNDDTKRKYIYIQKNGTDVAIHDAITTNININECIPVTEGDEISMYGYCTTATTLSGTNQAWDYFKVTVIS